MRCLDRVRIRQRQRARVQRDAELLGARAEDPEVSRQRALAAREQPLQRGRVLGEVPSPASTTPL